MNKQQQAYGYGHGHGHGDVPGGYCCFHPREVVVGVCAHCLRDRLLLLLAAANSDNAGDDAVHRRSRSRSRSSSISLPKVFALGSSFLQRLDSSRHHRGRGRGRDPDNNCYSDDATASVASLDDSFISIKFEDNGKATWDSHKAAAEGKPEVEAEAGKPAAAPATRSSSSSTVVVAVEHVKRGSVTRWRKQVVGRLLQLARWRRSSSKAGAAAAACHVGGLDGKKAAAAERSKARGGRGGWIRSLTRRRAHGDRAW